MNFQLLTEDTTSEIDGRKRKGRNCSKDLQKLDLQKKETKAIFRRMEETEEVSVNRNGKLKGRERVILFDKTSLLHFHNMQKSKNLLDSD